MKSRLYLERNKIFFYTAFFIMTLVSVYPLFFTGIGCGDDLQNYMIARWGNFMENASESANVAGRFYYYLVKPLNILPYVIDNTYVTKLFQVIPLVICFVLFARVIFILTRSLEFSFLFYLFFLVFSQVSGYTNLFVTYPFYFTFSFSLLLCSYLLLINYLRQGDKKALVFSSVLFAIGLLFYETYLFYLLIYGLTIYFFQDHAGRDRMQRIRRSFMQLLPFLLIVVVYLAVYMIFRYNHPSNYTGTAYDPESISIGSFFSVLWGLSTSAFPLTVYEAGRELFYAQSEQISGYSPVVLEMILNARPEWLAKGLLAAVAGYLLLVRFPVIRVKMLIIVFVVSALLIFMPHIPLAFTSKYTFYVSLGMSGYVTTFFSLFGVLLLMVFLVGYLVQLSTLNRYLKTTVVAVISGLLFIISIITDFSNDMICRDIGRANLKFRAMDEIMKADLFWPIPKEATFLGSELYENPYHSAQNLIAPPFTWANYINAKTGYWYENFINSEDDYVASWKKNSDKTWYIMVNQARKSEDIAIVFAKLSPPVNPDSIFKLVADSAVILYYSPYKIFSVGFSIIPESFAQGGCIPVSVDSYRDTLWSRQRTEVKMVNTVRSNPASYFTIRARGIDIRSIKISNLISPGSKEVYLYKQSRYGYRE